jgi:hypothetical protein
MVKQFSLLVLAIRFFYLAKQSTLFGSVESISNSRVRK